MSIKRADVGDPVLDKFSGLLTTIGGAISSSADVNKLVALLHGLNFESGLGGGISLRNTTASRVSKCHVGVTRAAVEGGNRARRGAGISCYIGAYPTIEDSEIANNVAGGDGGGVGIDQFAPDPAAPDRDPVRRQRDPDGGAQVGVAQPQPDPRQLGAGRRRRRVRLRQRSARSEGRLGDGQPLGAGRRRDARHLRVQPLRRGCDHLEQPGQRDRHGERRGRRRVGAQCGGDAEGLRAHR